MKSLWRNEGVPFTLQEITDHIKARTKEGMTEDEREAVKLEGDTMWVSILEGSGEIDGAVKWREMIEDLNQAFKDAFGEDNVGPANPKELMGTSHSRYFGAMEVYGKEVGKCLRTMLASAHKTIGKETKGSILVKLRWAVETRHPGYMHLPLCTRDFVNGIAGQLNGISGGIREVSVFCYMERTVVRQTEYQFGGLCVYTDRQTSNRFGGVD
jgi:hypothetical protein